MNDESEIKILEVNPEVILATMEKIGAQKILETRLHVDWFCPKGVKEGEEPWQLLLNSNAEGMAEVVWKGKTEIIGMARRMHEIFFIASDGASVKSLFTEFGLKRYAHQEKDRISWLKDGWRFNLDRFPQIPPYLEIEGRDESHIKEAIRLLGLQDYKHTSDSERVVIQMTYHNNWHDISFEESSTGKSASGI